jgi:uncharacterized protein YjcR
MPVVYLPMADLAKLYRVSPSTARKWAAADYWRRKGTRPERYHAGDAQRSFDQRHAGRTMRHLTAKYAKREDDNHG